MLRLDQDLAEFWSICKRDPALSWVPRRGAGRLLASPTLFEDLAKLLMTTNCTWAVTQHGKEPRERARYWRSIGHRSFPDAPVRQRRTRAFTATSSAWDIALSR
jgi:hypothetical protein